MDQACSARAARSTHAAGVPSGASSVGRWRRFIRASATSGRHRATSRSARSSAVADAGSPAAPGRPRRRRAAGAERRGGRATGRSRRPRSGTSPQLRRRRPPRPASSAAALKVDGTAEPERGRPSTGSASPAYDACDAADVAEQVERRRCRSRRARCAARRRDGVAAPCRSARARAATPSATTPVTAEWGRRVVRRGRPDMRRHRRARLTRVGRMSAVLEFADVTVRRGESRAARRRHLGGRGGRALGRARAQRRRQDHAAPGRRRPAAPDVRGGRHPRRGARHGRRVRAAAPHRADQRRARRPDPAARAGPRRRRLRVVRRRRPLARAVRRARPRPGRRSCSPRSAPRPWPTAPSAPSARASASASRSRVR